MRKLAASLGLVFGLLLSAPASPAQDPPPKNKDKGAEDPHTRVATEQDYKALAHMKEVTGKLLSLDPVADAKEGSAQKMTLTAEYPTLELKSGKAAQQIARQQQQAQQEYQRILRIRNPNVRQQRMAQFLQRQQAQQANPAYSPYRTVMNSVTFELPVQDKVKVARVKLPVEYDDKGNVIEYTKEELKKKKDPNMPGYTAKLEDVQPGQVLHVYLAKPRPAAKKKDEAKADAADKEKAADAAKAEAKAEGKDKEKAKDQAPPDEVRPEVRMILILADAPATPSPGDAPKKGKKKQQDQ